MAQEVQQISYFDFDVYGRSSSSGGALIHTNDLALSNAIVFFLTLKKGTYLYNENLGGVLDVILFKRLSDRDLISFQTILSKTIQEQFEAFVKQVATQITYDFNSDSRIVEVQVYFISRITDESNLIYVYGNVKRDSLGVVLIDVNLTGDNLIAFVSLNQLKVNSPLTFNSTLQVYSWGNYRFNNLKEGTEEFDIIKNIVGYQD